MAPLRRRRAAGGGGFEGDVIFLVGPSPHFLPFMSTPFSFSQMLLLLFFVNAISGSPFLSPYLRTSPPSPSTRFFFRNGRRRIVLRRSADISKYLPRKKRRRSCSALTYYVHTSFYSLRFKVHLLCICASFTQLHERKEHRLPKSIERSVLLP